MQHHDLHRSVRIGSTWQSKNEGLKIRLRLYDGTILAPRGQVTLRAHCNEKIRDLEFQIIDAKQKPLISAEASLKLGLVILNVQKEETQEMAYRRGCRCWNKNTFASHKVTRVIQGARKRKRKIWQSSAQVPGMIWQSSAQVPKVEAVWKERSDSTGWVDKIKVKWRKAKFHFDKTAKPLPELSIGEPVRVQTFNALNKNQPK
ncbi:uncharacterized protein [Heterodontus francisci]|uniref:uncharacterized protein n=1 Tax=Heterodontus francisci TaxID=7792 RepID=UPI00355C8B9C